MKGKLFNQEEVLGYLEEKIKDNVATYEEEQMYIDYKWDGKLNRKKHFNTYKDLVREMKDIYNNGF